MNWLLRKFKWLIKKLFLMEKDSGITGGVIILGSLYWENENNCVQGKEEMGRIRRTWRENNLDTSKTTIIALPVRYGRFSSKAARKKTYTMILSKEYCANEKLGAGLLVPFSNPIQSFNDFKLQASQLAIAEGICENLDSLKLVAEWGAAVALWINPTSRLKDKVNKFWDNIRAIPELGYTKPTVNFDWVDGSLITADYKLDHADINTDLDFLFCTYIQPKHKEKKKNEPPHKEYPTPKDIALAMLASGYQTYFRQNRENGIITSDDDDIISFLT
jgi:hypothetical protein